MFDQIDFLKKNFCKTFDEVAYLDKAQPGTLLKKKSIKRFSTAFVKFFKIQNWMKGGNWSQEQDNAPN